MVNVHEQFTVHCPTVGEDDAEHGSGMLWKLLHDFWMLGIEGG